MESSLAMEQAHLLASPESELTSAQREMASELAFEAGVWFASEHLSECWAYAPEMPPLGAERYFSVVVRGLVLEELTTARANLLWELSLETGAAEKDWRVLAFARGCTEVLQEAWSDVAARQTCLQGALGPGATGPFQVFGFGPYGQPLFSIAGELFLVFHPGEAHDLSRVYIEDHPARFLHHADVMLPFTTLREDALNVLTSLRSSSEESADEMLRTLLAEPSAFADALLESVSDWSEFMTAGLCEDAVVYEQPGGVHILRVLALCPEAAEQAWWSEEDDREPF